MEKGGKVDQENASILEVAETNFESECTFQKRRKTIICIFDAAYTVI